MIPFQGTAPEGIDAFIDGLIAQDVSQREREAALCWHDLTHSPGHASEQELRLKGADELADMQIRFPAFLLATHYWEGGWLMDMAAIDNI
ncbi:hypothetical protein [Buttiauxella noackiae]|uniref:hypothetical protein n=1 Tax=Buttiauxella noackiae TaxID=82992 RepID=UPI00055359B2|nr:hypothetical protein [Buttiauxella noackiae]